MSRRKKKKSQLKPSKLYNCITHIALKLNTTCQIKESSWNHQRCVKVSKYINKYIFSFGLLQYYKDIFKGTYLVCNQKFSSSPRLVLKKNSNAKAFFYSLVDHNFLKNQLPSTAKFREDITEILCNEKFSKMQRTFFCTYIFYICRRIDHWEAALHLLF